MAAPASFSTVDLTGSFTINKELSDSLSNISTPERAGADVGKMILSRVPVSSKIKHYKDADGVEHFDMENTNHDGQTKSRSRVLSGAEKSAKIKEHDVNITTEKIAVSTLEHDSLKEGWDDAAISTGVVNSVIAGAGGAWFFQVVLGVATINGEKRLVRKIYTKGPGGKVIQARLVYDYTGAN